MEKIRTILKILDRSSNKHFIKYQFFTTRFDRETVLDLLSRSIFSIQRFVRFISIDFLNGRTSKFHESIVKRC